MAKSYFRLEGLPLGTFLVRQRANNSLALMVKTCDGVKQVISLGCFLSLKTPYDIHKYYGLLHDR